MIRQEEKHVYSYTSLDKFKIKRSNFFWKIVDITSCKIPKIAKIYEKSIIKEYLQEEDLFEISKSKKILHIGCGSYPLTCIALSNINNGKIVGIDNKHANVNRALKIISNKGLGERVSLRYGDGSSFPLSDFNTIIVSSCSTPKSKILEHIFENAPSNCKIIIREQVGLEKLVLDYIDLYKDKLDVIEEIYNNAVLTSKWTSYCVVKK